MPIDVAILGANGTVGQKVISLLSHPSHADKYRVAEVCASSSRVGRSYGEEVEWRDDNPLPEAVKKLKFTELEEVQSQVVISALPADVAKTVEPLLAQKGHYIFSNASSMRMHQDVPLLIPEVNLPHLELLKNQNTKGKIVTNPNCSTVFMVLALAPLKDLSPLIHISVTTLQALSGAGFPGVASLDIVSNIIPNISGEEEKIVAESKKILGSASQPASFSVSAQVNRVPVLHGHTVSLHVEFEKPVSPDEVRKSYENWNKKYPGLYQIYQEAFRPQPLKDLTSLDQRAHIGRIQQGGKPNRISLICLGHNLVRGAAGAALLNMEASLPYIKKNL